MTIELMVFALWIAAIFLIFWQIIISVQFSRISGDLKVAGQEIEEGWNFRNIERLCQTMASEIVAGHEESFQPPLPVSELLSDSDSFSDNNYEFVHTEDYLEYLESRIGSLENLVDRRSLVNSEAPESVNMSTGHFVPRMTQYGHESDDSYGQEFTDEHYPSKLCFIVHLFY